MVYMQTEIAFRLEFSKENSDRGFDFLDIDPEEIEKCVNNSFDVPGNFQSDNRILREDRAWQNLQQIHTHPAISINNQTYKGDFNGKDIARALCASFKDQPKECTTDMSGLVGRMEDYDLEADESDDLKDLLVAGIFIVLVNIVVVWVHKSRSKKSNSSEIQDEVNSAVA